MSYIIFVQFHLSSVCERGKVISYDPLLVYIDETDSTHDLWKGESIERST
jgi:hypothetical protein